jgi:hypothetical protein
MIRVVVKVLTTLSLLCVGMGLIFETENVHADPTPTCVVMDIGAGSQIKLDDVKILLPEVEERIKRGLTVKWAHVFVRHPGEMTHPQNQQARCELLFDLWEEEYVVSKIDDASQKDYTRKTFPNLARAIEECMKFRLATKLDAKVPLEVISVFNPISEEQLQKTREWLAERGIGSKEGPLIGRAVGAMMDLSQQKVWTRSCPIQDSTKI